MGKKWGECYGGLELGKSNMAHRQIRTEKSNWSINASLMIRAKLDYLSYLRM